jgi:hypothetical protein
MSIAASRKEMALTIVCRQAGVDCDFAKQIAPMTLTEVVGQLQALNEANFGSLKDCRKSLRPAGARLGQVTALLRERLKVTYAETAALLYEEPVADPSLEQAKQLVKMVSNPLNVAASKLGSQRLIADLLATDIDLASGPDVIVMHAIAADLSLIKSLLLDEKKG